nr:NADH dehydrogenase subunit 6 [Phyllomyza sp.]
MIQFMINMLTLITSLIFLNMKHPLSMGLILLIQTMLICLMTGLMTKNFWFSYILFLIFIGGMLVLFIYVTSLASNEIFSFSFNMMVYVVIYLFFMLILWIYKDLLINIWSINNEMSSLMYLMNFLKENSMNLLKLYNYPTNMFTIMLMNYLLITLIAVVKITNLHYGPLRSM